MSGRKINLLIAVAGLGIGGAEVVIQHLVRSIDRRRFNVTVGCIKVAGPIGEALIMTAMGLAVAVPAVLGYNLLVRNNRVIIASFHAFAEDMLAYLTTGARVPSSMDHHRAHAKKAA